jgi:hypothetical protein
VGVEVLQRPSGVQQSPFPEDAEAPVWQEIHCPPASAVTKTAAMSALRKLRRGAFVHVLAIAIAITRPNDEDAVLQ